MTPLPGIDHPLILLRDIEAGRDFYQRLGFTMTPVGRHPWGTSTSLAVLERSALELMGIYDESLIDALPAGEFRFGRHMRDALAEREGISLVALHSRDAAADRAAMEARGACFQGHIGFRRRVRPPGGIGTRRWCRSRSASSRNCRASAISWRSSTSRTCSGCRSGCATPMAPPMSRR